ncbi:MAG: hypothetical protein HY764_01255 [Candidatus Portnoybacteria bacterium]|nr:hypothetical protein [Candidatus Portnoybacteria bacterium]
MYLASLELGQSTVQEIAKKAGINRPTSYFIIDGLIKKGLMSSFHKGKKQYFVAADPDNLEEILEKEKVNIDEKKKVLGKILPQLQSLIEIRENTANESSDFIIVELIFRKNKEILDRKEEAEEV